MDADGFLLSDLNPAQREAVTHTAGPLLVLAGPGSGKTRVITRRAAQMVHAGVSPRHILAITFTNKAAAEMRTRLAALGVAQCMWIYTFHALGARLLREFGELARVGHGFTIYDDADQKRLIKACLTLCGVNERMLSPDAARQFISGAKNRLLSPEQAGGEADALEARLAARVYEAYEALLEHRNAVDFDDLLMRIAVVLRDHPDVVERLNVRFQHLLIDEYQDTNHAQYLIASYLSEHHRNICATGDPDQSIYGWRGANISNILEFEQDYPDAHIVRLEENFRSTPQILRVASALIKHNRRRKHKDLWTRNPDGPVVELWRFREGRDEARHIAQEIVRLRAGGAAWSDCAIMYRVNAISRGLEEELRAHGAPYRIARGVEFYNRKEIKDTLAYLRVLVNPADEVALLRVINTPTRGIGHTTVQRVIAFARREDITVADALYRVAEIDAIKSAAAKKIATFTSLLDDLRAMADAPLADVVSYTLRRSGLEQALGQEDEEGGEDRLANVQELVSSAARYDEDTEEPSLAEYLQRISLVSDQDAIDESSNAVLLLTLHAAKGLEFPNVFIAGLEQGVLPHERSITLDGDVEEERRLMFVGVTRARERLHLSLARERLTRGVFMPHAPSQFVSELPPDCVTEHGFDVQEAQDGFRFEPTDEPGVAPPRDRRGRGLRRPFADPDENVIDVSTEAALEATSSPYAAWRTGTLVQHERYGVGQVEWVRPDGGEHRAAIRFAGVGAKVFVLERSPLKKLGR